MVGGLGMAPVGRRREAQRTHSRHVLYAEEEVPCAQLPSRPALGLCLHELAPLHEHLAPAVRATVQEDAEVRIPRIEVARSEQHLRVELEGAGPVEPSTLVGKAHESTPLRFSVPMRTNGPKLASSSHTASDCGVAGAIEGGPAAAAGARATSLCFMTRRTSGRFSPRRSWGSLLGASARDGVEEVRRPATAGPRCPRRQRARCRARGPAPPSPGGTSPL